MQQCTATLVLFPGAKQSPDQKRVRLPAVYRNALVLVRDLHLSLAELLAPLKVFKSAFQ